MSSISWLDADEAASEQARRLIAATTDSDGGTLDQLGLGAIRDFCSDHLFPGTSTLWSRARYLVLVPWCYQGPDPAGAQRKLRRALTAHREERDRAANRGIIGAQKDVARLPDEVVWNGLALWGIRLAELSRPAAAAARSRPGQEHSAIWHPRLPARPQDFPRRQRIGLEAGEAGFLAELLTDPVVHPRDRHAPGRHASRLPLMLDEDLDPESWDWRTVPASASPVLDQQMRDAACFADLAWSARALYALMVSDRAAVDPDAHSEQLDAAEHRVRSGSTGRALAAWDFDRFAAGVLQERPNARRALDFLRAWRDLVLRTSEPLAQSTEAQERIVVREHRVKRGRTRLTEERPEPVALAHPYDFRAGVARSIVSDIKDARP
ncbi:MAG TPA: DUF6361 family protein [Baekduia sp.]|uniref:DUF6361 family protein n=1 Tax=Baekduia sp. TaxID=2600305 RepID=UPI002CA1F2CC|nr:DUF6361 family protein [Baekduia sp.]HMJ34775.1 DUF6361 family protein [Baekduia sp.]